MNDAHPGGTEDDPVNGIERHSGRWQRRADGGLITGLVTDDATGDPVAGVLFTCYDETGSLALVRTVTTADGTYQLGDGAVRRLYRCASAIRRAAMRLNGMMIHFIGWGPLSFR